MSLARLVVGSVAVESAVAVVAVAAENGPFVEHLESLAALADWALVLTETAGFELEPELPALALGLGGRSGS